MKKIWDLIDQRNWSASAKQTFAFWIFGILSMTAGYFLWKIIGLRMLGSVDWMLCFMGYPVIFSFVMVYMYACRHEFHDGTPGK